MSMSNQCPNCIAQTQNKLQLGMFMQRRSCIRERKTYLKGSKWRFSWSIEDSALMLVLSVFVRQTCKGRKASQITTMDRFQRYSLRTISIFLLCPLALWIQDNKVMFRVFLNLEFPHLIGKSVIIRVIGGTPPSIDIFFSNHRYHNFYYLQQRWLYEKHSE